MDDNTPDVSTSAPAPEPTQDSPVSEQLQAPAAPAPQPQQLQPMQPAQPAVTTPAVPPSPNQRLHSFVSSVLGGITNSMAGKGPTKYTTDPSGRVIADPNQPKETTADKLRRIGATALQGLGAGARVPQQKSGLAAALAGAGAGAEAQTQQAQAQDQKAKQEAHENEEAAEVKKVRMHDIARGNALTASTYQHMIDEDQDRDPARKQSLEWAGAAKDAGVPVQYMTWTELQKMRESDPETIAKYQILPTGMKMVLGPDNEPIIGDDGKPKMEGQVALIDGLHNGSLPAPASFVSDLQKYGKYAGITGMENLKPGDDVSMDHFIKLASGIQEGKKKELEGWAKPELGWQTGPDGKQIPVQINSNTSEVRPFAPGVTPNVENKPVDTAVKAGLTAAQTDEAKAKTKEALANAALASSALSSGDQNAIPAYIDALGKLPPQSQALLRSVPPAQQGALLAVAAGDADLNKVFPTRTAAKSGQLDAARATSLVRLLNPEFNESLYTTKQQLNKDFTVGKEGQSIRSFGQFLVHADDVRVGSQGLLRTNSPLINEPLNALSSQIAGHPEVNKLMTDIMAARQEWQTFISSGHASNDDEKKSAAILMSDKSSPAQIMGVLGEMGKQAVGRLDQLNETYRTVTGTDYPNLVTPSAKTAATNLGLGNQVAKYKSGGTLAGVQGGNAGGPQPQQKVVDSATHQSLQAAATKYGANPDKILAIPNSNVHIAFSPAQKAYIVLETGQPYQQTQTQ